MSKPEYFGRCLCGQVHYRIVGAMKNLCLCHCESCRRATGAPFVAWGTVECAAFEVMSGELSIAKTSRDVERGFCGNCGSALTYRHGLRGGEIDVTLASLDDPGVAKPEAHIWVCDKLAWVQIDDGLPQYQMVPGVDA